MPGLDKMMKTDNLFEDKKILIWGYGREGQSTEKWLENGRKQQCHAADPGMCFSYLDLRQFRES